MSQFGENDSQNLKNFSTVMYGIFICKEKLWQKVTSDWVSNVIISILLKKGRLSCVRVSLKQD